MTVFESPLCELYIFTIAIMFQLFIILYQRDVNKKENYMYLIDICININKHLLQINNLQVICSVFMEFSLAESIIAELNF